MQQLNHGEGIKEEFWWYWLVWLASLCYVKAENIMTDKYTGEQEGRKVRQIDGQLYCTA